MLVLPDINKLKFKNSKELKGRRLNSSIYLKNYENTYGSINNTSDIIPFSQIRRQINNNSYKENKNKYKDKNSFSVLNSERKKIIANKNLKNQIKIINHLNDIIKTENEIIPNIIDYNDETKNKKSILNVRANYNFLTNIFFNRQIDINIFIKEINSLLFRNNKIFENIQNLVNNKIIKNKKSLKTENFIQSFKYKEIPINKFNYQFLFKCIIKNTFIESLKKAFLNNVLITKKEIKEEYEKQINIIKQYLNLYNKEKKDLAINKKYDPLIICNNSFPLYNSKIIYNNKKINFERNKRKKVITQSNSCDNVFVGPGHYNKDYFYFKFRNIKKKQKDFEEKNNSQSSQDFTPDKEIIENHIESIISIRKMDFLKEKRFGGIYKKQKNIIDDYLKLKEKIQNNENNLIKAESSIKKNNKRFEFLSTKNLKNKDENLINSINKSYKYFNFENSLINEKINKNFYQENKIKENKFNINSLNNFEKEKSSIESIYLENEFNNKDFKAKNNISSLKNSFAQTTLFDKKFFIDKSITNHNEINNKQSNINLIKENNSQLYENNNKAKNILNTKLFLKKYRNLNIRSFKDLLGRENYESKVKELNNTVEEKHNIENKFNTERLLLKRRNEVEGKL